MAYYSERSTGDGWQLSPFATNIKVEDVSKVPVNCSCPWVPRLAANRKVITCYMLKFPYAMCPIHFKYARGRA